VVRSVRHTSGDVAVIVATLASLAVSAHACRSGGGIEGTYAGTSLGTMTPRGAGAGASIEERGAATATVRRAGDRLTVAIGDNGHPPLCTFALTGGPMTWAFVPDEVCQQGRADDGVTSTVVSGSARFDGHSVSIELRTSVVFTGPEAPMPGGTHVMRFTGRRN